MTDFNWRPNGRDGHELHLEGRYLACVEKVNRLWANVHLRRWEETDRPIISEQLDIPPGGWDQLSRVQRGRIERAIADDEQSRAGQP